MKKMSRGAKHALRRTGILVIPLLVGTIIGIVRVQFLDKNQIDISRMISVATTMLSLWGTSLGFIITAESILVAFDGSYLTKEIKATEHFKTVIYTYTLTCIELLLMIVIFSVVIVENCFSRILWGILAACLGISLIDIFLCLIFLGVLIASTCKKKNDN
jgi:hypothetical protein